MLTNFLYTEHMSPIVLPHCLGNNHFDDRSHDKNNDSNIIKAFEVKTPRAVAVAKLHCLFSEPAVR